MNTLKKVIFFLFSCVTFAETHCSYRPSYATQGALIGLAASGGSGKGLAYGYLAGSMMDVTANAAENDRRRRYYDDQNNYYYGKRRKYLSNKNRKSQQSYEDLQAENEELRRQLDENENN